MKSIATTIGAAIGLTLLAISPVAIADPADPSIGSLLPPFSGGGTMVVRETRPVGSITFATGNSERAREVEVTMEAIGTSRPGVRPPVSRTVSMRATWKAATGHDRKEPVSLPLAEIRPMMEAIQYLMDARNKIAGASRAATSQIGWRAEGGIDVGLHRAASDNFYLIVGRGGTIFPSDREWTEMIALLGRAIVVLEAL